MSDFKRIIESIQDDPSFEWLTIIRGKESVTFTYEQLSHRVSDFCRFYKSEEVRTGDSILIILKESLDLYASFFAGIIYGAIPAFYAYPSPKQSNEQFLTSIGDLVKYNDIRLVISFNEVIEVLKDQEKLFDTANFRGSYNSEEVPDTNRLSIPENPDGTESFMQFSSGTTGAKKGVVITSVSLFNQISSYEEYLSFTGESKVVTWLPHYHDMGLIACMIIPFIKRVPIVMMSPFEWVKRPQILFENITKYKGTHIWLPNFALGHLTKHVADSENEKYDLSSLQRLVCCSEPVSYEAVDQFAKRFSEIGLKSGVISNCYAMAENTFAVSESRADGVKFLDVDYELLKSKSLIKIVEDGFKIASAGKHLDNTNIRIVDTENGELPEEIIGEILIQSNCMLEGYHNSPKATEGAFEDGWFCTGDMGFVIEGDLYVTGRKKELIIVGGENIYPQDIEQIVNDEPHFIPGRNVAFGIKDERIGTERIVILAEVDVDDHSKLDVVGLKSKIFNKLNISVSEIQTLEHKSLKKSTAGKISRLLNKEEYVIGKFELNGTTGVEDKVHSIILNVIPSGTNPLIDEDTELFKSGIIDSFGFLDLVTSIENEYALTVSDEYLSFEYFETISIIKSTIERIEQNEQVEVDSGLDNKRMESFERLSKNQSATDAPTFKEWIINSFPFPKSVLFKWLLRSQGISLGNNVMFSGKIKVKIRGKASNIIIGNDVRIGSNVDLRNRENGKIILHDRSYLDDNVRLVAARDGKIDIGQGTELGGGTIINSGGETVIGHYCMIAGGVNINSSTHGTEKSKYIKEQAHSHGKITIENDVWIGAGASILMNSHIKEGAVISSNSLVSGNIPPFSVCSGVPAIVIKYRSGTSENRS